MSVTEAAAALALVDQRPVVGGEDGSDLSPSERRFCELMITGPYPENATQCYRLVHPDCNYDTAGVAGPLLRKEPRIENYLKALRLRAIAGSEKELIAELKDWIRVAVKAKRLLEAHVEGTRRLTGTDLAIIREVLDRALGKSMERVEVDMGSRLDNLIKEIAAKRNGGRQFRPPERAPELPGSKVEVVGRVNPGTTQELPVPIESPAEEATPHLLERSHEERSEQSSVWRSR